MSKPFVRQQVTFYYSYFDAVQQIEDPVQRALAYDTILQYAYAGEEPDLTKLPGVVSIIFKLIRPTLDAGRAKAENKLGKTKNKSKTNEKQTVYEEEEEIESEVEIESEIESEIENKKEYKKESYHTKEEFEEFWKAYPKKSGRQEAYHAFLRADVPLPVLLDALEQHKKTDQWRQEGGRFIPKPANWLNNRQWEDQVSLPVYGKLSDLDLRAIERMEKEALS